MKQYAASPIINKLIDDRRGYFITGWQDQFYNIVWNIDTAQGFGLDIWGRIVGIGRNLTINDAPTYFGFQDGLVGLLADYAPFGSAPFYSGAQATSTYTLADNAYRSLILTKALSNISDATSKSPNQLLQSLFPGRGRCYVNDLGGMQIRYTFEFYLEPFEMAIVRDSDILPRGAGVKSSIVQIPLGLTFGFSEMNEGNPLIISPGARLGIDFILGESYLFSNLMPQNNQVAQPFGSGVFYS